MVSFWNCLYYLQIWLPSFRVLPFSYVTTLTKSIWGLVSPKISDPPPNISHTERNAKCNSFTALNLGLCHLVSVIQLHPHLMEDFLSWWLSLTRPSSASMLHLPCKVPISVLSKHSFGHLLKQRKMCTSTKAELC